MNHSPVKTGPNASLPGTQHQVLDWGSDPMTPERGSHCGSRCKRTNFTAVMCATQSYDLGKKAYCVDVAKSQCQAHNIIVAERPTLSVLLIKNDHKKTVYAGNTMLAYCRAKMLMPLSNTQYKTAEYAFTGAAWLCGNAHCRRAWNTGRRFCGSSL